MPLAPFNAHLSVAIEQSVQLLPKCQIRYHTPPRPWIWVDPRPSVGTPDGPPSAATFDDMNGVGPQSAGLPTRFGFDPGHRSYDGHHFDRVVRSAAGRSGGGVYGSVTFKRHKCPTPCARTSIERAVGVNLEHGCFATCLHTCPNQRRRAVLRSHFIVVELGSLPAAFGS